MSSFRSRRLAPPVLSLLLACCASAATTPVSAPCHVTVQAAPAPWAETPGGVPFRFLRVTAEAACSVPARLRLDGYGGTGTGRVFGLSPGMTLTLGPVPQYRRLSWLSNSGFAYDVPIH